jgi:hypothetical protein
MIPRKGKAQDTLRKIQEQYPNEGPEELKVRFNALMKSDESLKEDMIRSAIKMMIDEVYDEAAREGREIPKELRKPS